jgi:spore coat protein U-like protein
MKRTLLVVATIAFLVGGTTFAQTDTTFQVTANVAKNCTIQAANLAFGTYDPLGANASAPLDQNGSVSVACTKGTAITIALDAGLNHTSAVATTRAMNSGSSYMDYELYTDSPGSTVWNDSTSLLSWTSTGKATHSFTVYGRVPGGQDTAPGSYSDTITATVNF